MDIKEILGPKISILPSPRAKQNQAAGNDFQKVLEGVTTHLNQGRAVSSPGPGVPELETHPGFLASMSFVNGLAEIHGASQSRTQALEAMDRWIDTIEHYQQAIADPEIPLKRVEPLVQSLSKEAAQLNVLSERLPLTDPLRQVVTEAEVISSLEVGKFYRGDYL
jgi:hypothetical protein